MADRPRFGPAGVPLSFRAMKATLADVPRLLKDEGLDAFEYQAVRWGAKPQMRRDKAEQLGLKAEEHDVWLSLHGSYFINFCGKREIIEASKNRLIACATAAEWMKAHVVVFHPGFYGKKQPKEAFEDCLEAVKEVVETMKTLGIRNVKLGPETMGKISQFGSLDEILGLCEQIEQTQPVIDWAHLHADKGERRHHTMYKAGYGPDFTILAKVIAEFRLRPVIISESPVPDLDAIKMREILKKELS